MRYVLAFPALAAELDVSSCSIRDLPETGSRCACIAEWRQDDGDASADAMLIERFQGSRIRACLFDAQAMRLQLEQDLDAEAAEHDFMQIQLALRIKRMNQEIESLKARVNADPRAGPAG